MAVTFNAADRVGVIGGYIGGIGQILSMLGGGVAQPAANGNGNSCGNNCGCGNCSDNAAVSRYEQRQSEAIARLQSENAMLLADQRTDGKILELYKVIDQRFGATGQQIAQIAAQQAVVNQQVADNMAFLTSKIDNDVASLKCYVDANFVPGVLKMPLDSICPKPQAATATTTEAAAAA